MAGFAVTISAVDAATATINKINAAFTKFLKPVKETQTAFSKLGKDSGLEKLAKSFGSVGGAAAEAADKLGLLRTAGGLGGIGTVSGLAAMTRQWAEMGNQISVASYKIGIGADQLGKFQAAARLAGISDSAAEQGASALAKNIGDVLSGRNPTMAGYFAQLGIRARYDANGRPDVASAYRDIQAALARAPTAQGKNAILDALGQPQELRLVVEKYDELGQAAARMRPALGAAAEAGKELNTELARMKENAAGVGDNIERVLAPGLKKITGGLADVAQKANELTQSGTGSHVGALAAGAGGGFLAGFVPGAVRGALIGGAAGLPGGLPGVVGGALIGGLRGGVIGGAIGAVPGAVITGGIDALGNAGGSAAASGIKWNNPGNLRIPGMRSFQTFATPQAGLEAAARNLAAYRSKYGIDTVSGIVSRWAPRSENDTGSYIRGVSDETGLAPAQHLDNSVGTNAAILGAIVRREQGKQPFTADELAAAMAKAMGQANPGGAAGGATVNVNVTAPPGSTATANSDASRYWPVRIRYTMPNGSVNP